MIRAEEILLVREREDGGWTIPGGWADVGEAPSAMVVREVKEESGFDVVPRKLAAIYDRNKHPHPPIASHAYKIFFYAICWAGGNTHSETPEVGFFRRALPQLSAARITPFQIEQMSQHAQHPERPTTFD